MAAMSAVAAVAVDATEDAAVVDAVAIMVAAAADADFPLPKETPSTKGVFFCRRRRWFKWSSPAQKSFAAASLQCV